MNFSYSYIDSEKRLIAGDYFGEGENWIWNPDNQTLIAREPSLF